MGRAVVHWEIWAKDAKKLQDYYSRLFDWQINANNPINYGLVNTGGEGGINGGIFKPEKGDLPQPLTFYVRVDNVQAYLDKAVKLGGKTVVPPPPFRASAPGRSSATPKAFASVCSGNPNRVRAAGTSPCPRSSRARASPPR